MLPFARPGPRPTRWIRTGGLVTCGMTRVIAAIFPRAYPPVLVGWAGAVLIVTSLYFLVFVVTEHHILKGEALVWAACNGFPHVLLAVPLVDRVGPKLGRLRLWAAVALAVSAALAYAALAYSATIFLLALTSRIEADGLWVQFFQGPAVVWQSFQALAYAALALTVGRAATVRVERWAAVWGVSRTSDTSSITGKTRPSAAALLKSYRHQEATPRATVARAAFDQF